MPIYTYQCCGGTWENLHVVDDRANELCETCGQHASITITNTARPIIYEYYDNGLGKQVTGPKHRTKLMRSGNLEEK